MKTQTIANILWSYCTTNQELLEAIKVRHDEVAAEYADLSKRSGHNIKPLDMPISVLLRKVGWYRIFVGVNLCSWQLAEEHAKRLKSEIEEKEDEIRDAQEVVDLDYAELKQIEALS